MSFKEKLRFVTSVLRASGEACPMIYKCREWTLNKYIRYLLKLLVTPFYALRYFHVRNVEGREGLAFVIIVKNEAPYIEEWINFHHKQGVSHFFIYDNESEDNLHEVLMPYINSGLVTYQLMTSKYRQVDAYNMTIHDYGDKFKYMGFIDADEFVFACNVPVGGGYNLYTFVDDFMTSHKNAGGIAIPSITFGSNGHVTKPEGGVLENYTRCQHKSGKKWVKSICDPLKVLASPMHKAVYRKGYYTLTEDGEIMTEMFTEIEIKKIRINHYSVKSREEFIAKRERGWADKPGKWPMTYFEGYDRNECEDTEILSHV